MICPEELESHILAEHEAGELVRALVRGHESSVTANQNWKRQAKAAASEPVPSEDKAAKIRGLQRRVRQLEQEIRVSSQIPGKSLQGHEVSAKFGEKNFRLGVRSQRNLHNHQLQCVR